MVLEEGAASVASARSRSPPHIEQEREKVVAKPSWEVKYVPGKGQGMFATRHIKMGEVVIREEAVINMPDEVFQWEDMDRIERWLDRRINQLSSDDRAAFFELADSRAGDEGDGKTTLGIFFTNTMNFWGDAALFPTLARSNHSCAPNADFVARKRPLVQDIVATRDIFPGEEITLSYLPACGEGSDVREVRQAYLREWYGFRCCCTVCGMQVGLINFLIMLY